MIKIVCDVCKKELDSIKITKNTSFNYIDFWRKTENHICNSCWIKQHKIDNMKLEKIKI